MTKKSLQAALTITETLLGLAGAVVRAVRTGDTERVSEIIPGTLVTTLAKAHADEEARKKFTKPQGADAV